MDQDTIQFNDYFNPELTETLRRQDIAQGLVKRLKRKIRLAFLGMAWVVFLPFVFSKYRDFDVIRNSPVFRYMLLFMVLYALIVILSIGQKMNSEAPKTLPRLRRHLSGMDLVSFIALLLAVLVAINTFFLSFATVDGTSMYPTLQAHDSIILQHFDVEYERFDLVVANINRNVYYVKRIIGLPHDVIEFEGTTLRINGERFEEPYLLDGDITCHDATPCTYVVPAGHVFVLGDNRNNSTDSRSNSIGPIPFERLYGRVTFRIGPTDMFGPVN